MVTVLAGPAAMNENHTSFTVTAWQVFVVKELVAPTELELMQMAPLAGMITGWAVRQLSFAGWPKTFGVSPSTHRSIAMTNHNCREVGISRKPDTVLEVTSLA